MTHMELLYLTEDDVRELLDLRSALGVVEDAFREHGMERVQMPAVYILIALAEIPYAGMLRNLGMGIVAIGILMLAKRMQDIMGK